MQYNDGFRIPKNLKDAPEMGRIPWELLTPVAIENGASAFFANTSCGDFRHRLIQHIWQTINNLEKILSENPDLDKRLIYNQIITINANVPLDILQDPWVQNIIIRLNLILQDSDFPLKAMK